MNDHEAPRGHRTRLARPFIAAAFVLERLGDAVVIYASSHPTYPDPILRGVAVASLVWTTALTVGVWRHLRWARYVLTTFGWAYALALCYAALRFWEQYSFEKVDPRSLPLLGAVFYLAGTTILVRSRRVRHFANR